MDSRRYLQVPCVFRVFRHEDTVSNRCKGLGLQYRRHLRSAAAALKLHNDRVNGSFGSVNELLFGDIKIEIRVTLGCNQDVPHYHEMLVAIVLEQSLCLLYVELHFACLEKHRSHRGLLRQSGH